MFNLKFKIIIPLMLLFIAATSCNDLWDEHYGGSQKSKADKTLFQLISEDKELSTFASMLQSTGLDTMLNKPVTYTVWAPVNSAKLDSIAALNDLKINRELVMNHISRFAYPTAGITTNTIFMLNRKFISFNMKGNVILFGGSTQLPDRSNRAATNGILHVIESPVPYLSNIWEFILKTPGLDSLRNFLDGQSTYAFDPLASVEIGTNEFGQAVYDSVIIFSNDILARIGALHLEDSVYSVLLPNNQAWTSAYNYLKSKYRTLLRDGGPPRQRLLTQQALVENLVFRELNPETNDSIVSTTGTVFRQPAYLFEAANITTLSNGIAFVTDSLRFRLADSWQKNIVIEAENSDFGRSFIFANLFVRSSLGTPFSGRVSDTRYLLVEPTTVTATQPASVTFPIPNVLSGRYRIYGVFVPSSVIDIADVRPYRVRFYVSHMNNQGVVVEQAPISATHQLQPTNRTAAIFTSTGGAISKMFVTEIEFPFSNIVAPGAAATQITTRLRVENAVTTIEEVQRRGDRRMRIDYIILEPVP